MVPAAPDAWPLSFLQTPTKTPDRKALERIETQRSRHRGSYLHTYVHTRTRDPFYETLGGHRLAKFLSGNVRLGETCEALHKPRVQEGM